MICDEGRVGVHNYGNNGLRHKINIFENVRWNLTIKTIMGRGCGLIYEVSTKYR